MPIYSGNIGSAPKSESENAPAIKALTPKIHWTDDLVLPILSYDFNTWSQYGGHARRIALSPIDLDFIFSEDWAGITLLPDWFLSHFDEFTEIVLYDLPPVLEACPRKLMRFHLAICSQNLLEEGEERRRNSDDTRILVDENRDVVEAIRNLIKKNTDGQMPCPGWKAPVLRSGILKAENLANNHVVAGPGQTDDGVSWMSYFRDDGVVLSEPELGSF